MKVFSNSSVSWSLIVGGQAVMNYVCLGRLGRDGASPRGPAPRHKHNGMQHDNVHLTCIRKSLVPVHSQSLKTQ